MASRRRSGPRGAAGATSRSADIEAGRVARYLEQLRTDEYDEDGKRTRRGIAAQTSNFHLAAVKQFCRWMVREKRALENPVDHLGRLNVRTDRRHDRRALTVDELQMLLEAADAGPERRGMTGPERALAYRVAVETGLRASELRSLTRQDLELSNGSPSVTVKAKNSKRRREDTLPLKPATATLLEPFVRTLAPACNVFRLPRREYVAGMLRADLEAAGIPYRDEQGRVADFHALRHAFVSNLVASGVAPKTAQALARHSTIESTLGRYTHLYRGDEANAIASLPDLDRPPSDAQRATGTDGGRSELEPPAPKRGPRSGRARLASSLASGGGFGATGGGGKRRSGNSDGGAQTPTRARETPIPSGEGGIRTRERDKPVTGFQDRRLQPLGHLTGQGDSLRVPLTCSEVSAPGLLLNPSAAWSPVRQSALTLRAGQWHVPPPFCALSG